MTLTLPQRSLDDVNEAAALERARRVAASRLIASPDALERVKVIEKDTLFCTFNV
jgi:hypothetical protein